MQYDVNY